MAAFALYLTMGLSGCSAPSAPSDTRAPAATGTAAEGGDTRAEGNIDGDAQENTTPQGQKVVTVAMMAPWDTSIPLNTTNVNTDAVLELILDKLIVVKADGSFKPRLADSQSMDDKTHTKIIFNLNKNAKQHDGRPVTTDDVVYTAELISNPNISVVRRSKVAPFVGTGDGTRVEGKELGVKAIDANIVEFTLKDPTNLDCVLDIMFRDFYILPKHRLENIPVKDMLAADFWKVPIGSSPCIYESEIFGERVEFTANKDYHINALEFDRFVVRIAPASDLLPGLMNGGIDIVAGAGIGNIPLNDWDMTGQQKNLTTEAVEPLGYQYLSCNTKNTPQKVRQTVNMTISRDAPVNNLMKGEGVPAPGPLASSHRYSDEELLPIPYDVDKVKQMVEESGFDTSKTYRLNAPKGNEVREKSAPMVQQGLAKIGINVEIITIDHPTLLSTARRGEYDFTLIGSSGLPDLGESVIGMTLGHLNSFSQNEDPSPDEVGREGLNQFSFEDRRSYYDEYQMMFGGQHPFVWLYFQKDLAAYNKKISNVCSEDYSLLNRSAWEWHVEQSRRSKGIGTFPVPALQRRQNMAQPLLEVKHLKTQSRTKGGTVTAVDGVNFSVNQGDTLGIAGESGCGKNATSLPIPQLPPHVVGSVAGGEILYKGEDITKKGNKEMYRIRGREISMIFQDFMTSLSPMLTIGRQLEETISAHSSPPKDEIKKQAPDTLTKVGVSSPEWRLKEFPHQLSGGMRQRVMIVMALSCGPPLLITDESTMALDVTIRAQIIDLMAELKKNINASTILTTHDMGVVAEMVDYIMVMYAGRVMEYGSVRQTFKEAMYPYTQGFLASIPRFDRDLDRLFSIDGMVPFLDRMPKGCRFCARYLWAMDKCRERQSPVYITNDGRKVSCWKYENLKGKKV